VLDALFAGAAPPPPARGRLGGRGLESLLRGGLLRVLLRPACAGADDDVLDHRRRGERAVVRRPLHVDDGVGDRRAAPCQLLLQLRLVVDVRVERVLDARVERLDDRGLDRLEAVLEVEGRERRLEERRQHVAVPRQPLDLALWEVAGLLQQALAELELARDDGAARPRDDVRADLRHAPLVEVRKALEEGPRDRELEDGIAEELQPFVRGRAVGGPRRMREDRRRPFRREPVDQLPQRRRAVLTGAT
jgi:hypothetical protein